MRQALTIATFCAAGALFAAPARIDYGRDVRPILSENCFHCHGQDSGKRMANLRLDTAEGARPVLASGKLYQRITSESKALRMPPAASNRSLTPDQIAVLKQWIDEGGGYSKHWAFVPPVKASIPEGENAIDALVRRRLDAEGLKLNRPAAPGAWLRRVSLDLTGLPPTPEEIAVFEKKPGYAAEVDRLLASRRYGERMAMDWLDVARYADTHGFNNDAERSMWRWRDWVIESFNSNQRYDRFLTEQLAGDLLPRPTLDQRIATGFGRNHVINSEGGIIDEEYRVEYVADRVRTLGMSWLGLTLECARCHDHKYDPVTQRDYYRFYAFFNNVPEIGEDGRVSNAVPMIPAPTADQQKKLQDLEASMARLTAKVDAKATSWRWHKKYARLFDAAKPAGATIDVPCAGACVFDGEKPMTPGQGTPISKRGGLTMSAWIEPSPGDRDVPLLSAIDYARNRAATTYGTGIELRLTNGELEFRFGARFPAYSIRVRTEGAGLAPGERHHVALTYEGAAGKNVNRVYAAWVHAYVDGRELPMRVMHDGFPLPDEKSDKGSPTRFRIGWDNSPDGPRFAGRFHGIAFWDRALTGPETAALFESSALPPAVAAKQPSAIETGWLRRAVLRREDPAYKEREAVRGEWFALRREMPTVMVMDELSTPRETHVLLRGGYNTPGEKVEPGVPEHLLGGWPEGAPRNRLGLAQWLTKPDHPTTARVVVNRFWQQIFGQGLVKTSENFGVQGESPSHPELLDWLAREFIDSGWDVKALLKQIVLSGTYRQDSAASKELIARDPENRLLARGPRFRLPAETIRDQALQFAGLLKNREGGPSVRPYQPAGLYTGLVVAADYPGTSYVESKGDDLYRRSLYTWWKRTVPHPTMTVFDAPDREFCIVRRSNTNTPLQALTLLNDPIFVEAARKLAERAMAQEQSSAARLALMFQLASGRAPDDQDREILGRSFERMLAAYKADGKAARAFLAVGASPADSSLPAAELAAYAAVANMILNLDEVITKG